MITEVTRCLDELGVAYTIRAHEAPAYTAEDAALHRGIALSQIVKCLIGSSGDSLVAMLLPGDRRLKSSLARKHLGAHHLALAEPGSLEAMGLIVGAIAPYHLLGRARMLMDPSVMEERLVDISSGDLCAGVELESEQLLQTTGAELVPIVSTRVYA